MKTKLFISIIVVALIIAVIFRIFSPSKTGAAKPSFGGGGQAKGPTAVKVDEIKTGNIVQQREFTGTIDASYTYKIAAKVAGSLSKISKRIGDEVHKNEVIGQIEDTEFRLAVDEASAQVKVSQASIDEAKAQASYIEREFERISDLVGKGISSQADLDAIQTQLTAQRSRLALAEAQYAQRVATRSQARTRLGYTALRSSKSGFVSERHTDEGALLSVNTPVLTVVGIDTVYIQVPVTERDYPFIQKGIPCRISVDALPDTFFTGIVSGASAAFRTDSRAALTEIAVVNKAHELKPGMFARIVMDLSQKQNVQLVPIGALIVRKGSDAVFVVKNETARLVPVVVGIKDLTHAEIISPPLDGKVVTLGQHLLSDNAPVITGSESKGSRPEKENRKESDKKGALR